ncbi:hypothetical protein HK405_004466, partial [Cladochytrium tenue]
YSVFHDEGGNAVEVTVIDLLDEGLLLEVRTVGAIQGDDDDDEQTPWQVDTSVHDGRDQWDDSYHETDAAENYGNSADTSNHWAMYERYFAHEDSDSAVDAGAALTLEIGQVLAAARIINSWRIQHHYTDRLSRTSLSQPLLPRRDAGVSGRSSDTSEIEYLERGADTRTSERQQLFSGTTSSSVKDLETADTAPPVAAGDYAVQPGDEDRNQLASELEREGDSWRGGSNSSADDSTGDQDSDDYEGQSDSWDFSSCPLPVDTTFVVYRGDGETATDVIQAQRANLDDWLMMLPVLDANGELCGGGGGSAWDAWERGVGFAMASSPSSARAVWDELIWRGFDADGNPTSDRVGSRLTSPHAREPRNHPAHVSDCDESLEVIVSIREDDAGNAGVNGEDGANGQPELLSAELKERRNCRGEADRCKCGSRRTLGR